MSEIICEGKTVEQAIKSGMDGMDVQNQNDLDIEVLQEPGKSIFGLLKPAKVKLKTKEKLSGDMIGIAHSFYDNNANENNQENYMPSTSGSSISLIENKINKIFGLLNVEVEKLNVYEEGDTIYGEIKSLHEGLLIGKHGQTLEALQYIVTLLIKSEDGLNQRVVLDVGNYRDRHKSVLEKTALKISEKVVLSQHEEALDVMSPFDRRIVHMLFKDSEVVKTYSQGEGNFRRVIIAPK